MVVDIPSVPVLENMYNNINRIEKGRGLFCCYFSKAGREGSRVLKLCPQKFMFIVGMEEAGISKR